MTDVAEITGVPEMMDGRVKTCTRRSTEACSPRAGTPSTNRALQEHAIPKIDLLAVTLYPFEEGVAGGADFATTIENIDIGGPALIRAGAKKP